MKSMITSGFWKFIDEKGVFLAHHPNTVGRLYFPLGNEAGIISAVTPDLHGDIKTGQNHFLTAPVCGQDLHNSRSRRDFWVLEGKTPWLANAGPAAEFSVEAGPLWHKLTRISPNKSLKAEFLNFVPTSEDTVEIMEIRLTNISKKPKRLTGLAAVPLFARSADNLRDHRHVTSLLHRIYAHRHGVIVAPVMSFDERGHKVNNVSYGVLGFDENGRAPAGSFPTVDSFIGEGGNFDRPAVVMENIPPRPWRRVDGREAVGALKFKPVLLKPGKSFSYVLVLGIAHPTEKEDSSKIISRWKSRYGSRTKASSALESTKKYWEKRLDAVRVSTGRPLFDNWLRWVTLQPMLRKIFGCSFLPDFDYGRGGRGWRDLWQDCLALLLLSPENARPLLLNNFKGVRIDGANATIIGRGPGEFIADRNSITRVWMDHGVWPYLTTELYIHQTGDFSILWEELPYFRDTQLRRAKLKDPAWSERDGRVLKTISGEIYRGTVLEHILVQTLAAYHNAGEHNVIRLEDADWNDGLDMAHHRGESVAFTAQYAGNLRALADLLDAAKSTKSVETLLSEEVSALLESTDFSVDGKIKSLNAYFDGVCPTISGKKKTIALKDIARRLRDKEKAFSEHLRRREWISSRSGHQWFNGYYDDDGRRVEGDHPRGPRMTLTGQVFPIMSGVATNEQIRSIWNSARRYLKDKRLGGFRLNTDFKDIQPSLGRAFSFAYGEKENGAFFNHMAVMFANGLYRRGFVKEGREVFKSIFNMAANSSVSKIYPGLPEYFNGEGRGMYHYLTGSASWLIFTYLTLVCGVRGRWGDLLLEPKLSADEFGRGRVDVFTAFAGRRIHVSYENQSRLDFGKYSIRGTAVNGVKKNYSSPSPGTVLIPRAEIADENLPSEIRIDVLLG